jgi:hypothetical protein
VGAKGSFRGYWRVYGGLPSLVRSTYFWVAVVITIVTFPFWSATEADGEPKWVSITIDVMPSLMGFALGGMAIMLAFSTGRFLEAIRQKGREDSYFMKVIASFFHFTTVLGLALLLAVLSKAFPSPWLSGLGFFASVYGVLLAVATVDHLWQTAVIFNKVRQIDGGDNDKSA